MPLLVKSPVRVSVLAGAVYVPEPRVRLLYVIAFKFAVAPEYETVLVAVVKVPFTTSGVPVPVRVSVLEPGVTT